MNWVDIDEAVQNSKTHYNFAENEVPYIIVTATERGDRGECHIGFP